MRQFVITYNGKYFNTDFDCFRLDLNEASTFSSYKDAYDLIASRSFRASKVQEVKTEIKLEDAKIPFSLFLEEMVDGKAGRVIFLITTRGVPSYILEDKEANIFIVNHFQNSSVLINSIRSSSKTTYIISSKFGPEGALGQNADIVIQNNGHLSYTVLKNRDTGIINVPLVDDSL